MVQTLFVRTGEDSLRPGKNTVVDQRPFDLDAAVVPGAALVVTPRSIVLDAAVVLIAAAGAAGQTFRFEQEVFHGNALTKHGDFANDVAKGFVFLLEGFRPRWVWTLRWRT